MPQKKDGNKKNGDNNLIESAISGEDKAPEPDLATAGFLTIRGASAMM